MTKLPSLPVLRVAALVALAASTALLSDYTADAPSFCSAASGCGAIRQSALSHISFGEGKFEPECLVTGGVGTMPFQYKGKTYYDCCTGCKDLFNEDPDFYIAEYEAKLKKAGLKQ